MNQDHQALIKRVSKQVAFRTNPRYGYEMCSPEDISQGVWVHLLKDSVDLDLMDSPEAYVRQAAVFEAFRIINSTLRRPDEGGGLVNPVDLSEMPDIALSTQGLPEDTVLYDDLVQRLSAVVAAIVAKVSDLDQREAVEGYYLRGEVQRSGTIEQKRRSRGTRELDPADLASLQAWRSWLHPELKRPPKFGQVAATPLIEALT